MTTVHKLYPTWNLGECFGTNKECIDYCKKSKTKVDGFGFVEHGKKPAESGERTDLRQLMKDAENNTPYEIMAEKYPWHMLNMPDKIEKHRQNVLKSRYSNTERKIHTTYIYGAEGTGKTTFVYRVLGCEYKDVYKVSNYKHTIKFNHLRFLLLNRIDDMKALVTILEKREKEIDYPQAYEYMDDMIDDDGNLKKKK